VNTAVAFYAGFTGFIVASMLFLNLGILSNKQTIINPDKNIPFFNSQFKQQAAAIAVYVIATVVAFYNPTIALILTFLMWVF
jgi:hypothetical protein